MPIALARRLALAVTLATAAAATAGAQDSTARIASATGTPCDYASCVLRIEETWLSQTLVTGDGRVVARLGWGGPRLDRIVAVSDSAVVHARAYRRAQNTGSLLTLVAALAWVGSAVAYADDRSVEAIPISLGAAAVGLAGRSLELRARRELARSVWWYNRAVLGGG